MKRFNLRELSAGRIYHALQRRIENIPSEISWNLPSKERQKNQTHLAQYVNKHIGHRCFIIGNGPSISKMNLSPLEKEFTFGMNRIYLAFDKLCFVPTYFVCVNELVLKQFASEIKTLTMPKFLNWDCRSYFNNDNDTKTNFIKLNLSLSDRFNTRIDNAFYSGGTVTYVAIQLAYIMGFSEIVLIGVDHSFEDKGTPNKVETRNSETDTNHFHPNYFPKGIKWQLPDLLRSELAYTIARDIIEKAGNRIFDATVGGKLDVFEKVKYSDLFYAK